MNNEELTPIEITNETFESLICDIRGQKVMLDFELARIYGYTTKAFNQQVRNNINKFPERYRFKLTKDEVILLRSKKLTSDLWTSGKGGRSHLPYAFTEQGIYMLMTVLKGELATRQSIALIDAFKQMKDIIVENRPLLGNGDLTKLVQTVGEHSSAIAEIRSDLKTVMDNFIDESSYKHFIILEGEKIEADVAYQGIYAKAKSSIIVVDDYIDVKTLQLLKSSKPGVAITIVSDNKARNGLNANFIQDSGLSITFKKSYAKFHDRYIIIDYNTPDEVFYHCGASSKDSGNKISAINRLGDGDGYHPSINAALAVPDYTIV